jgi:hypothetical protein
MTATKQMNRMERLSYRGPDIDQDGVRIDRFTIGGKDESFGAFLANLQYELQGRGCQPGTYARLIVDDTLWMSDTTSERHDHLLAVAAADLYGTHSVNGPVTGLVNGLGMGCVVGAFLDVLSHVDVVESDQRIIDTVGAWYQSEYGDRLTIHHGDAMTIKWPKGRKWHVVWHDIWPTIGSDNLAEMTRLHRRYGGRSQWQGSWCQAECRRMRDVENNPSRWW